MSTPNFSMIKSLALQQCARDLYGFFAVNGIRAQPRLTKDDITPVPGADIDQWNLDYPSPIAVEEGGKIYRVDVNVAAGESKQRWADAARELRAFYGIASALFLPKSVEEYFDIPKPKAFTYVIDTPVAPTTRVGKLLFDVYYSVNGIAQDGEVIIENSKAYRCVPFNAQMGGEVERSFGRAWKMLT